MPSPPKPWEVNNGASTPVVSQSITQPMTETATTTSSIPTVPNRPSTMGTMGTMSSSMGMGMGMGMGGLGSAGYGTSSYGVGGYGNSYGSSYGTGGYGSNYSRMGMGGYGGGYGGGYSSYGSYGGMNSYNRLGSGGYNRFGGGPEGGPDEFGLTQRMETSTRATFDVIESIVSAFGGFAQMLDSTYMATHSSFMAMVGVAEQFGNLRHYLGGIFSIFALIRWMKRMLYRLTGRTPPPELYGPTEEQQANPESARLLNAEGGVETGGALQITDSEAETTEPGEQQHQIARVSRKRPIIIFLALVTGLPYLMYKLIQRSNEYNRARQQRMMVPQFGGPPPELARVMHDFIAENAVELTIRRGEMIHVLSKVDPATGGPCDWWQGRTANGTIGIFPANYVQIENSGY